MTTVHTIFYVSSLTIGDDIASRFRVRLFLMFADVVFILFMPLPQSISNWSNNLKLSIIQIETSSKIHLYFFDVKHWSGINIKKNSNLFHCSERTIAFYYYVCIEFNELQFHNRINCLFTQNMIHTQSTQKLTASLYPGTHVYQYSYLNKLTKLNFRISLFHISFSSDAIWYSLSFITGICICRQT